MAWRTSERADWDLVAIEVDGTHRYGANRAASYVDELFELFWIIAAEPRMMRKRPELRGVRLYRHRAHYIVYRIEDEDVVIVRVLHVHQNLTDHL